MVEGVQAKDRIDAILDYWFTKDFDRDSKPPQDRMKYWFMSTPEIDKEISDNFKGDLLKLAGGEYETWKSDRDGKLAAIILAD